MPLTAPPDHSKTLKYLAIGASICVSIFALTRHTTPIAGDNIHRLPFGGCYRDGTKSVLYNRPNSSRIQSSGVGKLEIFIGILLLIATILFLSSRRNSHCHVCGRAH